MARRGASFIHLFIHPPMHLTRTLCTPTVCQTLGYSMLGKQILQKNVTRDICVLKKTNDEIGEEGIHKEFPEGMVPEAEGTLE